MTTSASIYNEFKLRVNIKTDIESAYKAWATPNGLESWFLRKAVFKDENGMLRPGDSFIKEKDNYTMLWHGHSDDVSEHGKVLKANGKDLFIFTFSLGCPVSITIYTEQEETIVELTESDLPTDDQHFKKYYVGDSKGWIFYLTNLKSILEGGLDLRNKNEALPNVITA